MISEKMIEAAARGMARNDCSVDFDGTLDEFEEGNFIFHKDNAEAAITAAIDAAWTRFEGADESTWPKAQFAPSGNAWVVIGDDGQIRKYTWDIDNDKYCRMDTIWTYLVKVRAYADPTDFTPSWTTQKE